LQQAYTYGPESLLWPQAGYLQTLPRLVALISLSLPLKFIPLFFAEIAFVIQLIPAIFLLTNRASNLVPSFSIRLFLSLYYIGEPDTSEIYVNLTNAMWHLAIIAFLVVISDKPKMTFGCIFDLIVIFLVSTTGPFVILLAPIAWWHVIDKPCIPERRKDVFYATLFTIGALIQGVCVIADLAKMRIGHLGITLSRLVHILANHIFLGGTISAKNVSWLIKQPWWSVR
jgi:hypothetical protein